MVGAHHDTAPEAPGRLRRRRRGRDPDRAGARPRAGRAAAAHHRLRLVRRRGGVVHRQGHDRGLARLRRAARARAPGRWWPRSRSRCAGWKGGTPVLHPIAYADPREKGRAVIAPAWLVRAALAGSSGGGRAPRRSATRTCPGSTSPRCGRSACGSTATTSRSCRRATPRCSPRTRRSPPSTRTTTSRRTPPTSSTRRRSSGWGAAPSGSCARSSACRADRPRSRTGSRPSGASSAGRGCSRSARRACCRGWGAAWRSGGPALGLARRAGPAGRSPALAAPGAGAVDAARPPPAAALAPLVVDASCPRSRPALALVALGASAWWRGAVNGVWLAPWEIAVAGLALALAFLGLGGRAVGGGRNRAARKPAGRARRP